MGDRSGCGGVGCVLAFLAALLAVGYYAYTNRPLQAVYETETTKESIEHAHQIQEQRRQGLPGGY